MTFGDFVFVDGPHLQLRSGSFVSAAQPRIDSAHHRSASSVIACHQFILLNFNAVRPVRWRLPAAPAWVDVTAPGSIWCGIGTLGNG